MQSTSRQSGPIFIGLGLLALAVTLLLSGCSGPAKPSANVNLHLDANSLSSGSTTTLSVTVTNDGSVPVDGSLEVVASKGEQYLQVATTEPPALLLPAKDSGVTRIYTLTGTADLQVVPVITATVKNNLDSSAY